MRRVLVTGFEPFGGESVNPSAELARSLNGLLLGGARVHGAVLSCTFQKSQRQLKRLIAQWNPSVVICLGQAGGRSAISIERVAINVQDACIKDNAGMKPIDVPIHPRGPVGYWSSLPIKSIARNLRKANIKSEVSQTAGTFVCNHVFYALMHMLRKTQVRAGFIHVPFVPAQAKKRAKKTPFMSLQRMQRGIELAIKTSLRVKRDAKATGGATH
jgi:pyroglutamyl-peptidase